MCSSHLRDYGSYYTPRTRVGLADDSDFCLLFAVFGMKKQLGLLLAILAYQNEIVAVCKSAVFKVTGLSFAVRTLTDSLCLVGEVNRHTIVKNSEASFP